MPDVHFHLGSIPPGIWIIIIALILIIVGKAIGLSFLFYMGIVILSLLGLYIIIGFLREF